MREGGTLSSQLSGQELIIQFCFVVLVIQKSTSLKYEPSLELLLNTAKQLFLNRELYRSDPLTPIVRQELIIQFCFVVLFGVAFPLTGVLALLSNVVEMCTLNPAS